MKFLLDANACIQLLRPGCGESIRKRIDESGADGIALCSVVRTELLFGALRSRQREHNLAQVRLLLGQFPSLPFDDAAGEHAADIRAALAARGAPIGPADVLIAAIARANGFVLVTHNVAEFSRVAGLHVDDWQGDPGPRR